MGVQVSLYSFHRDIGIPLYFHEESGLVTFEALNFTRFSRCHIHIATGKLHLRFLWKVGSPLQSKTGNQLSSWDDMGCMELSSSCCTDINIHIDLRRVSQGNSVGS